MKLYRIRAVIKRLFKPAFFDPGKVFNEFFWPLMDILIMGMTALWMQKTQSNVPSVVLAILGCDILWQVFVRSNYAISGSIIEELWDRNIVNLFSTPLKLSEWIVASVFLGIIKAIICIIWCAVIVWFFYAINIFAIGLPLFFLR